MREDALYQIWLWAKMIIAIAANLFTVNWFSSDLKATLMHHNLLYLSMWNRNKEINTKMFNPDYETNKHARGPNISPT